MLINHGYSNEGNENYVKIRVRKKIDFHFINVDLELESMESVQPLIRELGDDVFSLYCSDRDEMGNLELSHIEKDGADLNDEKDLVGSADRHISEFCGLIENLSMESRQIWDKCLRKEFDIGFQCGNTPKSFQTRIQADTVSRCAGLGATIMITVYPHYNYEVVHQKDLKKQR